MGAGCENAASKFAIDGCRLRNLVGDKDGRESVERAEEASQ